MMLPGWQASRTTGPAAWAAVDENVAAGRVEVHDDGNALLAHIAGLPDHS